MTPVHVLAELDTERCEQLRSDLSSRAHLCSYDELRVLDVILKRLELGRQRYGYLDIARDGRNFKREKAEEDIDSAIYDACDVLSKEAP